MSIPTKSYAPQDSIPVTPSTHTMSPGATLSLTVSTGGTGNRYQWFRNGVAISSVSTSPNFTKAVTPADAGVYTCQVTSTIVTGLTLTTTPITVTVLSCPPANFTINGSSDSTIIVNVNDAPLTLSGTPAGGTFTGEGVIGESFYPDLAGSVCNSDRPDFDSTQCVLRGGTPGPGNLVPAPHPNGWPVTYTYSDASGCSGSKTKYITVLDANTASWTGTTSTDWFTPSNWSTGAVPGAGNNVFIPASAPNMPLINSTGAVCKDIMIRQGASCSIGTSGILNVKGNWNNAGTFSGNGGTVVFSGAAAQTLLGSGSNTFQNLTLDNAAGLALQSAVSVRNVLALRSGNLASGGNLKLLSVAAQTALVDDFSAGNTGSISGAISVQRYVATPYRHLIASPVTGATSSQLSGVVCSGTGVTFQQYNEPLATSAVAQGWATPPNCPNTTFDVMRGYRYTTTAGQTLELSGSYTTGSKTLAISRGTTQASGWNVIGNPYASPISWTAFLALNPGVTTGIAYFSKPVSATLNQDITVNSTGLSVNGGNTYAYNTIGSMQGFMIRKATTGTASITMNNGVRLNSANTNFFRTESAMQSEVLRLKLSGNGYEDETAFQGLPVATDAIDLGFDAEKLHSSHPEMPSLYTVVDDTELAINALPILQGQRSVTMGIRTGVAGTYTLSLTEMSGFGAGTRLFLEDKRAGRLINLENTKNYSFKADKSDSKRFVLHFNPVNTVEKSATRIYAFSNHVVVELGKAAPASVVVYNLLGQPVKELATADQAVIEFSAEVPEGVYVVQVRAGEQVSTQKVFLCGK